MKLTKNEVLQKVSEWATICNIPIPKMHISPSLGIPIPGGVINGQFNPHTNEITIYGLGLDTDTIRHEFIHYLRKQMGLNYDWQEMFEHRSPRDNIDDLLDKKDFEEGRTYYLNKLEWPKILDELKLEKSAQGKNNSSYNPPVDECMMQREKNQRLMQMSEKMGSMFAS